MGAELNLLLQLLLWIVVISSFLWVPLFVEKYKNFRIQKVFVTFDEIVNVGFHINGSNLSFRFAMHAPESDDTIFGKFHGILKRNDGSKFEFHASHIEGSTTKKFANDKSNKSISELRPPINNLTSLNSTFVTDKDVVFFESLAESSLEKAWSNVIEEERCIVNSGLTQADLLKGQETGLLIEKIKDQLIWRPGKYTFTFMATSPNRKISMKNNSFSFELTHEDCALLDSNKILVARCFETHVCPQSERQFQSFISTRKKLESI